MTDNDAMIAIRAAVQSLASQVTAGRLGKWEANHKLGQQVTAILRQQKAKAK